MKALYRFGPTVAWAAATLLCVYVAANALRYLAPAFSGPEFIERNAMAQPWLAIHAGFAAAALVIGPVQFLPVSRRRWPRLHRWLGRVYITACLVGGLAGLLLAGGTTAGPVAAVGFGLQAVLFLVCAVQAWRLALARQFERHREWVIRSYALVFAGVTLRLWLPLSMIAQLDFMTSYQVISFLAWVPNLVAAELYLAATRARRPTVLAA